jgi:hypothetical protein
MTSTLLLTRDARRPGLAWQGAVSCAPFGAAGAVGAKSAAGRATHPAPGESMYGRGIAGRFGRQAFDRQERHIGADIRAEAATP